MSMTRSWRANVYDQRVGQSTDLQILDSMESASVLSLTPCLKMWCPSKYFILPTTGTDHKKIVKFFRSKIYWITGTLNVGNGVESQTRGKLRIWCSSLTDRVGGLVVDWWSVCRTKNESICYVILKSVGFASWTQCTRDFYFAGDSVVGLSGQLVWDGSSAQGSLMPGSWVVYT